MSIIKKLPLLEDNSTLEEVAEVLTASPLFFPGKVLKMYYKLQQQVAPEGTENEDENDEDELPVEVARVRTIKKKANIEILLSLPVEDVVEAWNAAVLRRVFRVNRTKNVMMFFNLGFSYLRENANETQKKLIDAYNVLVYSLFK